MDIEIINEILKGNTNAFELLIDKYEKMVYNLAFRMLNNTLDAEDITQDVFIKLYKNIEKCSGKQSIKTWVYTIAYNSCIDELRKKKGKNYISLDKNIEGEDKSFSLEIPSKDLSPEEAVLQKENINEIEKALLMINEQQRALIYLRDIKGLSYVDIGAITGLTLGTVKSRLNRARTALRKVIKF